MFIFNEFGLFICITRALCIEKNGNLYWYVLLIKNQSSPTVHIYLWPCVRKQHYLHFEISHGALELCCVKAAVVFHETEFVKVGNCVQ
jgi:hypothetical protein